jgi:hypothetical protein
MIEQMPKAGAFWNLLPLMYVSILFELLDFFTGTAHH